MYRYIHYIFVCPTITITDWRLGFLKPGYSNTYLKANLFNYSCIPQCRWRDVRPGRLRELDGALSHEPHVSDGRHRHHGLAIHERAAAAEEIPGGTHKTTNERLHGVVSVAEAENSSGQSQDAQFRNIKEIR